MVRIDRRRVLEFFDEIPKNSWKHATAVCSVAGEDLGAGLLKRYLETEYDAKATILEGPVTTGKQKGPRLDRWVEVAYPDGGIIHYQIEVKNWSAHAIGGSKLKLDASPAEVSAYKRNSWNLLWDQDAQTIKAESLVKVLVQMKCPVGAKTVEPVACLWRAVHREGADSPWFSVQIDSADCCFKVLHVFSMSSYLRNLTESHIEIEMPDTARRLQWLNLMF